jgi:hypothetical protein
MAIDLDAADDFTRELADLMHRHRLGVFIDDCQVLKIDFVYPENIDHYLDELLDNTARQ